MVQHSILEHRYAAREQHSKTQERFSKLTSRDWIDPRWLLICAIDIIVRLPELVKSRMHCNPCTSSSISINSLVSKWDRAWNPVGSWKKLGENGSLLHWSSVKVVWSTMRLDPVMTVEFKSCLLTDVRVSNTRLVPRSLPKYGPFDSAAKIYSLCLTDIKQLAYCLHMKLSLRLHPKASLDYQYISLLQI